MKFSQFIKPLALCAALSLMLPIFAQTQTDRSEKTVESATKQSAISLGYKNIQVPVNTNVPKDKIEVLNVFWYGCKHCYQLKKIMDKWEERKPDNVEFVTIPALFGGGGWDFDGQVYLTLDSIGALNKGHQLYFDSLQLRGRTMRTDKQVADFFEQKAGIKKEDFLKAWNSFAVKTRMTQIKDLVSQRYALDGVPVVIVEGKYLIDASSAGGTSKIPNVLDELVAKVTAEKLTTEKETDSAPAKKDK